MAEDAKTVVVGNAAPVLAVTPEGHANQLLVYMTPLAVILVRTARVYLQSLLGLLPAGAIGNSTGAIGPGLGHTLTIVAVAALGPALMCALQNTIELLTELDKKLPQLRG